MIAVFSACVIFFHLINIFATEPRMRQVNTSLRFTPQPEKRACAGRIISQQNQIVKPFLKFILAAFSLPIRFFRHRMKNGKCFYFPKTRRCRRAVAFMPTGSRRHTAPPLYILLRNVKYGFGELRTGFTRTHFIPQPYLTPSAGQRFRRR